MEYKSQKIDGQEVYYSSDWIGCLETESHFKWYHHQARMVYELSERNEKILEIGVGTGLLSDMLKKRGWDIQTLDIDEDKCPDFCVNALDFDYEAHKIETILAFEIFEHIPYVTFEKVVRKLKESEIRKIYFSLPWNEKKVFGFSIKLPKFKEQSWSVWCNKNEITTQNHFWEISKIDKHLSEKNLASVSTLFELFKKNGYELKLKARVGVIQYFTATLK